MTGGRWLLVWENAGRPSAVHAADALRGGGSCYQHGRRSAYYTADFGHFAKETAISDTSWNAAAIKRLESDLRLPEGFVENLKHDDDWSFIVKAHALLEASLTHTIMEALGREELREVIARLSPFVKLGFAEALNLLTKRERACVGSVFSIRNLLAHDITHVQFHLTTYVAGLSEDRQRELALSFMPVRPQNDKTLVTLQDVGIDDESDRKYPYWKVVLAMFRVGPKVLIHLGVMLVVAATSERKLAEKQKREHNSSLMQLGKEFAASSWTLGGEGNKQYRERVLERLASDDSAEPTS